MYLWLRQDIAASLIFANNQYHAALFTAKSAAVKKHSHAEVFITSHEDMTASVVEILWTDTDHSDAIKQMSIGVVGWFIDTQSKKIHTELQNYQHIEGKP